LSFPVIPSRATVSVSSIPSRREAAAPGWLRSSSSDNSGHVDDNGGLSIRPISAETMDDLLDNRD
jgi:hypothetical protein